jgi:hypothetical protein
MLEWVANDGRVLITHDVGTMSKYAYERVANGKTLPGVLVVPDDTPLREIVDDILLLHMENDEQKLRDRVTYLPL